MNLERRVDQLEAKSGVHGQEYIVVICSNVKDDDESDYPSPDIQMARARAESSKRIFIRKYCGTCKEHCMRRRTDIEPEKQT